MNRYEKAREVIEKWQKHCASLKAENASITQDYNKVLDANKTLQKENEKLRVFTNSLPDPEVVENHKETIKQLRKKLSDQEENYKEKLNNLLRDKILLEGRVQHLEESRKDLQERYTELKQDFREHQKK